MPQALIPLFSITFSLIRIISPEETLVETLTYNSTVLSQKCLTLDILQDGISSIETSGFLGATALTLLHSHVPDQTLRDESLSFWHGGSP